MIYISIYIYLHKHIYNYLYIYAYVNKHVFIHIHAYIQLNCPAQLMLRCIFREVCGFIKCLRTAWWIGCYIHVLSLSIIIYYYRQYRISRAVCGNDKRLRVHPKYTVCAIPDVTQIVFFTSQMLPRSTVYIPYLTEMYVYIPDVTQMYCIYPGCNQDVLLALHMLPGCTVYILYLTQMYCLYPKCTAYMPYVSQIYWLHPICNPNILVTSHM